MCRCLTYTNRARYWCSRRHRSTYGAYSLKKISFGDKETCGHKHGQCGSINRVKHHCRMMEMYSNMWHHITRLSCLAQNTPKPRKSASSFPFPTPKPARQGTLLCHRVPKGKQDQTSLSSRLIFMPFRNARNANTDLPISMK